MRLLLGLLATTVILRADALADLKSALRSLPAKSPVRMKVDQKGWDLEEGKRESFHESFVVSDGPENVKVIEGAARANRKGSGRHEEGASGFVRPQVSLLRDLADAKLLEEKAEILDGKPVRRLRLAVMPELDDEAREHLKRSVSECTFWVAQDGLPVAWSRNMEIKVRVLLFFSMDMKLDMHRKFQKYQDRLVVVSESLDVKGKAMGHAFAAESRSEGRVEP